KEGREAGKSKEVRVEAILKDARDETKSKELEDDEESKEVKEEAKSKETVMSDTSLGSTNVKLVASIPVLMSSLLRV
ncbi:hypothetical protein Droror1_Dr00025068, partial [Drosera rotundifolia]